jgi:V/A-type H+/Na+-transporting ATPase subunit D
MLKYSYNKSEWHGLGKQLKMRQNALPTLKSKESALRLEVKKARKKAMELAFAHQEALKKMQDIARLWSEFDENLVRVKKVETDVRVIAGVRIPVLKEIQFDIREISQFHYPYWFLDGIVLLEDMTRMQVEYEISEKAAAILEYARKKTTQKVNLYEKVQIPELEEAMQKIKRYLEDEENLSKSAQKILKRKLEQKDSI